MHSLVVRLIEFDKWLVDDACDWLAGSPVKDSDEDSHNPETAAFNGVGVVNVARRRRLAADVIVGAV